MQSLNGAPVAFIDQPESGGVLTMSGGYSAPDNDPNYDGPPIVVTAWVTEALSLAGGLFGALGLPNPFGAFALPDISQRVGMRLTNPTPQSRFSFNGALARQASIDSDPNIFKPPISEPGERAHRMALTIGAMAENAPQIEAAMQAKYNDVRANGLTWGERVQLGVVVLAAVAPKGRSGRTAPADGAAPLRPTWRASELDVGARIEGQGYRSQVSFKDGDEVSYGTKGSVRPEHYNLGSSIEVKNYSVETVRGRSSLVRNASRQAVDRARSLPPGTTQNVYIDVRGQNVSIREMNSVIDRIVQRSNGAVNPENVIVLR